MSYKNTTIEVVEEHNDHMPIAHPVWFQHEAEESAFASCEEYGKHMNSYDPGPNPTEKNTREYNGLPLTIVHNRKLKVFYYRRTDGSEFGVTSYNPEIPGTNQRTYIQSKVT